MSTGLPLTGTVPASGTELAYLRIGEGPQLVIIPGGPRFGFAHMRRSLDALATGREIIYVDERGSGSSAVGDPDNISPARSPTSMRSWTASS